MTSVLDRVDLSRVSAQARDVHLGQTLLKLITGLFLLVGWVIWGVFFTLRWCYAAVKIGFQDAEKRFGSHAASG
jgi:hypothetical protein